MTHYLQHHTLFPPLISNKPSLNLGIIVVIPCYDEAFLLLSLMSLKRCRLPVCDVEVVVVVNDSEKDSEAVKRQNEETFAQAQTWASKNSVPRLKFHVLYQRDLPVKHAGVGLARKIGMDEACWRFQKIKNPNGIIVGFDADSKCDPDYFEAIWTHFSRYPKSPAASIYFEHPLLGVDFEEGVYRAIVWYELHLRYYIDAQRWAGFPFATQTIGSSLAVRCRDYQAQGGMNRRKAGEDFYFLHKFTPLGHFGEITETRVMPSPRPSHRVPFGTGRAVQAALRQNGELETYAPESFRDLRHFFDRVPDFFGASKPALAAVLSTLPEPVQLFLESKKFEVKIAEIQSNTRQRRAFINRFFKWMNAFMVMKFLHFSREHYYPNVPVSEAARWLLSEAGETDPIPENPVDLLAIYRQKDRGKFAWR